MTNNHSANRKARVAVIELWRGDDRLIRWSIRLRTAAAILAATIGLLLALAGTNARAATLGPELVDNGGFDTADGWTLGYGWGISPGAAPAQGLAYHNEGSGGAIWRPVAHPVPAGAILRVTYTASGTAGASDPRHFVRVRGDSVTLTPIVSGDGTYTFDITAPANVTRVDLFAVYGCACVFDDLSVRVLTP